MKILRTIWIPIAALLLWLILSWFLGDWVGLHAPALYYLRGGLSILGIIGFIGYLLLRPKTAPPDQSALSSGEIDDNFNEAAKRLQTVGVKQIAAMPAVFFIGDSDSAKTSVISKSDIAQLLSGQAQQEVAIIPTRSANFWLAKNTVLVDPAGSVIGEPENRKRLFKRFSPVALGSVMGSRILPARSVVFTISCETLLQRGGADALAVKARQFQTILSEMAHEFGSHFPVYVLFTKADKLSYFRDFVENLSEPEAAEVFGITLPMEAQHGVYAQQETARLNNAFQQLFYWLADRRPPYLIREYKPVALPNIYEFPREFNKLRPLIISFLVDLCRPSQLGVSPFLRGFYFTGIRAVTVNDVAPAAAAQVPQTDDSGFDSGATRMFTLPPKGAMPLVTESRESASRKIAQWVYLPQFLPNVVLADNTASNVGNSNVKLNLARRAMWGVAAALAVLMMLWWGVSFHNNHALVHDALNAAQGAPSLASQDALERLTKIKDTLATLNYFEENGRPLSYGGFLYTGDDMRESVSKAYYGLFYRLLLKPTQENLVQVCRQPSDAQAQTYLYDDLKSYLMTTQYQSKTVPEFLTPTLLLHWKTGQTVTPEEERLARVNFDFYSRELLRGNKYWPATSPDAMALASCREYLKPRGQADAIYPRVLADAGANGKPIIFNDVFPGTEPYVTNHYRVDPAFTKPGFDKFQQLLTTPKKYLDVEPWVLELKPGEVLDSNQLVTKLQQLYKNDFVKKWVAYLVASNVHAPANIEDAVAKLEKITSDRSPLLLDLCLASENTSVANKEVSDVFKPVQAITPPGCLQTLVSGEGNAYLTKLVALQGALKAVDPRNASTVDAAQHAKADVETGIKTMALNFSPPTEEPVLKMLRAPLYAPEIEIFGEANTLAGAACQAISPVLRKYPFNSGSNEDATIADVDSFLKKPDGHFWKLVNDDKLKPFITQFGDTFAAAPGRVQPKASFIEFLNRAAALSHVLYGPNSQLARFKFTSAPSPHLTLLNTSRSRSTDPPRVPTPKATQHGNSIGPEMAKA